MNALNAAREPVVVTFPVPVGLSDPEVRHRIECWYGAIAPYDFVYLGGTSFAMNPPCPPASVLHRLLRQRLGEEVEVEALSHVLQRVGQDASCVPAAMDA